MQAKFTYLKKLWWLLFQPGGFSRKDNGINLSLRPKKKQSGVGTQHYCLLRSDTLSCN